MKLDMIIFFVFCTFVKAADHILQSPVPMEESPPPEEEVKELKFDPTWTMAEAIVEFAKEEKKCNGDSSDSD